MKTYIRRFNELGIEKFRNALNQIIDDEINDIPLGLLTDAYSCEIIRADIKLEQKVFTSKEEIVKYLFESISKFLTPTLLFDKGMWSWLAAFYFDSICPKNNYETRKVGAESRYILDAEEWNRYYRHLLAAPIRLYRDLGDLSKIYLSGKPDVPGDLFEQLASRQEIAACKGVIEAATILYWDNNKLKIKKNVRDKEGAGVLRRFVRATIPQFQMTYDLNSMRGEDVVQLLPREYDKWKSA
jgi:hypothetical protein